MEMWLAPITAVICPRHNIKWMINVNDTARSKSTIFLKNLPARGAAESVHKKMWQPQENSWAVEYGWVKVVTWEQKYRLRSLNPKWCRNIGFSIKCCRLCQFTAILGQDERLNHITKVFIQPLRHVLWLRKPDYKDYVFKLQIKG